MSLLLQYLHQTDAGTWTVASAFPQSAATKTHYTMMQALMISLISSRALNEYAS